MITFTGNPGDQDCKILFSARPVYKDDPGAVAFERDLIYGHRCTTCGNVIQALFKTEAPVNLWKYEETAYVSGSDKKYGEINRFIPGPDSKAGYSQYDSTFQRVGKGIQHLLLRNHVLQYEGLNKERSSTDGRHSLSGGYPCPNVCVFSRNPDLAVRDLFLFFGTTISTLLDWIKNNEMPIFEEVITNPNLISRGLRAVPSYGDALPAIAFPQQYAISTATFSWIVNAARNDIIKQRGTSQ